MAFPIEISSRFFFSVSLLEAERLFAGGAASAASSSSSSISMLSDSSASSIILFSRPLRGLAPHVSFGSVPSAWQIVPAWRLRHPDVLPLPAPLCTARAFVLDGRFPAVSRDRRAHAAHPAGGRSARPSAPERSRRGCPRASCPASWRRPASPASVSSAIRQASCRPGSVNSSATRRTFSLLGLGARPSVRAWRSAGPPPPAPRAAARASPPERAPGRWPRPRLRAAAPPWSAAADRTARQTCAEDRPNVLARRPT